MNALFLLVPLALLLATASVAAFLWAVRGGEFEDMDTPALRVILDDAPAMRLDTSARPGASHEPTPAQILRRTRHSPQD